MRQVHAWGIGLLLAWITAGCAPPGGASHNARIIQLNEAVGLFEVAEDAETELRQVSSVNGVRLLTTGALVKLPPGSRIRLKFIKTKGALWLHGPAEVEVVEARMQRGKSGIHSKIEDIHASLYLKQGVFSGAMEGPVGDRPSIEVTTDDVRMQLEEFGKFAVIRSPRRPGDNEEDGGEAWVRDLRGPGESSLLLEVGGKIDFPPGAVVIWDSKAGPSKADVDTADKDFLDEFLDGLCLTIRPFDSLDQLLDEVERQRVR